MKEFKGLGVVNEYTRRVFSISDVMERMIQIINKKSNLNLTKKHIKSCVDVETCRFTLSVNEENFIEDEWENCKYNLEEWYTTFDELLCDIFEVTDSMTLTHGKYDDSDEYIIIDIEND